jgi:hypothetical protein
MMFNNPINNLNIRQKIRNNAYNQLNEIYTDTKTALQFINDNHTRNYNRVLLTLSSNLNFSKADSQDFLNDIRAEYTVDCQMANFLKQQLQKDYEECQKFGVTMKAIDELVTTDSQAQEQLGQLLTALTNTLNAK